MVAATTSGSSLAITGRSTEARLGCMATSMSRSSWAVRATGSSITATGRPVWIEATRSAAATSSRPMTTSTGAPPVRDPAAREAVDRCVAFPRLGQLSEQPHADLQPIKFRAANRPREELG